LRPRIEKRPGESTGECCVSAEAEIAAGLCCEAKLLRGPGGAGLRIACKMVWSEAVEERVIGGMAGDELALQMRRELRNGQPRYGGDASDLIAVALALCGARQI